MANASLRFRRLSNGNSARQTKDVAPNNSCFNLRNEVGTKKTRHVNAALGRETTLLIPSEGVFFLGFSDLLFKEIDLSADQVAVFDGRGGEFVLETFDTRFVG